MPSSLAFTPDGQRLAIGNADGTVQLWSVTSPAGPGVNPAQPRPFTELTSGSGANASPVDSVAVNPSGQLLVAGRDDGTVSVWNLASASGSQDAGPERLTTDTNRVTAVAFGPDGMLASGSADETVQLWNLNVNTAIGHVCSLAGSNLTALQWQTYIPQFPYQPPCPA